MATLSKISNRSIKGLGQRLRQVRMERGQSMAQFSKTLGVSTDALRSMEMGRPGVSIGQWAEVLRRLNRLGDLDMLLTGQGKQTVFRHQAHQRCLRQRSSRPRV